MGIIPYTCFNLNNFGVVVWCLVNFCVTLPYMSIGRGVVLAVAFQKIDNAPDKTTKGNKALKTILTQCAKSAKTVKSSYFSAQYQRISARRGKNRATLAVAHSMLIAIYHILKNKTAFHDLGSDYYDSFKPIK